MADALATGACEVFAPAGVVVLCPRWRVAVVEPTRQARLLDLLAPGAAMAVGALPQLTDGEVPRALTQDWARAIYEDRPTGGPVDGVRYRSAYRAGTALALWDSGPWALTRRDRNGDPLDIALDSPQGYPRLLTAMTAVGLEVIRVPECALCPGDGA